jgi:hypothetical protein
VHDEVVADVHDGAEGHVGVVTTQCAKEAGGTDAATQNGDHPGDSRSRQ